MWGIKKNGFKITKTYKEDLKDFPLIKKDYRMLLKKKHKPGHDLNNLDEYSKVLENDCKSIYNKNEHKGMESKDGADEKDYEWHNYIYDQLDSSGDSGCPESDFEEIKSQ